MRESLRSALQRAAAMLGAAGIEGAERDARALLAHVMKMDRALINAHLDDPIEPSQSHGLDQAVAMRVNHRPVSHITGMRAFWNHDFLVNADVLDPRPDTETLVALALEGQFDTVLDLGTGSGVLAISLADERPNVRVVASDISERALDVARRNAGRIGVAERIRFVHSDWFDNISGRFDLIVSNPPYIAADEMADLSPDVAKWEPRLALTPEGDGLEAYRRIAARLAGFLNPGGRAMVEIGYRQADSVKTIFTNAGYADISVIRDMNNRDRVVAIG